jgi:BolA protein
VSGDRVERIRSKLTEAFAPTQLDIVDDSHQHAGHAGAKSGGGHFRVTLVSSAFDGKTPLQRHRMVYAALGQELAGDIHALSIQTYAPAEAPSRQ